MGREKEFEGLLGEIRKETGEEWGEYVEEMDDYKKDNMLYVMQARQQRAEYFEKQSQDIDKIIQQYELIFQDLPKLVPENQHLFIMSIEALRALYASKSLPLE